MISIAYHLGQYAVDLDEHKSVIVQSLRTYGESLDTLVDRIRRTFGSVQANSGAIIMSVNSTGQLARNRLLPAMSRVGFCNTQCIAIASTPSAAKLAVESLTKLGGAFEGKHSSECEACREGSTVIRIQEDSYFLSLAAHVQFNRVKRSDAKPVADFVNRYRGIGAFKVHFTHSTGRHHAFYVDLMPMLQTDRFKDRLSQRLREWQGKSIDLIIHPDHRSAQQLVQMVADYLGVEDIVQCDENLQNLNAFDGSKVLQARSVCLVDDAVVTGARLFGYRSKLNQFCREYSSGEYDLYCVVGVSRPVNARAAQGIADVVNDSASDRRFLSVEQFFLPCWDRTECPWCKELEILESSLSAVRLQDVVAERIEVLEGITGVTEDLFVPWNGSSASERNQYWRLGANSIFGEVQGADLMISVASTIQSLRSSRLEGDNSWSESKLDEVFQSPSSKILDPEFYIGRRFFESVLVASILRSLRPHDVLPPSHENLLIRQLKMLLRNDIYGRLQGEIAFAIARKHLPSSVRPLLSCRYVY